MEIIVNLIGLILKGFALYTALMWLAALLPHRALPRQEAKTRFAVVIAARNEAAVIGGTVRRLLEQQYPRELFDVYVIPNNCTDHTALAALEAGARILPCTQPVSNKGDALRQGFQALTNRGYDAFCVFDADNLVDGEFLARMNDAFCAGAKVAKGALRAVNPRDSWVAGCYDLHFAQFELLYDRPRSALGLSGKLVGTGFMVSADLLEQMGGWNTETIAEDAEFAARCALLGQKIWWVPEAVSYDEEPVTFRQSLVQRRRWCSGIAQVGRRFCGKLSAQAAGRKSWQPMDTAIFLAGPTLQMLALVPALWSLQSPGWYLTALQSACTAWAGTTALAAGLAVLSGRSIRSHWKSILLYPVFMASWVPLHLLAVFHASNHWQPMARSRQDAIRPDCTFNA